MELTEKINTTETMSTTAQMPTTAVMLMTIVLTKQMVLTEPLVKMVWTEGHHLRVGGANDEDGTHGDDGEDGVDGETASCNCRSFPSTARARSRGGDVLERHAKRAHALSEVLPEFLVVLIGVGVVAAVASADHVPRRFG